jgi:hypothetical protein
MNQDDSTPPIPPPGTAELESGEALTKWPTVIGVISLIYACGGLLCGIGYGISSFFMEALMRMGGMDIATPAIIKVTGLILSLCMMALGILMIAGAVATLRRRRSGPKLLRTWAVLRIILLLLGIAVTVLSAPAQIQLQREIQEAQADMMRESGRTDPIEEKTDEEIWRGLIVQVGIMTGVMAVYPFFLGLYLSRRKIMAEVEQWR